MLFGQYDYLLELAEDTPITKDMEVDVDPNSEVEIDTDVVVDGKKVDETEEVVLGTESFTSSLDYYHSIKPTLKPATLDHHSQKQPSPVPVFIRKTGNSYRIWLRAEHWFTSDYINRITRFLDSRTKDDKVTIYLGCKLPNEQTCIVGAIISAMMSCACPVKAIAVGSCGVPETMLFCFAHEREIRRYGALCFGSTEIIRDLPMYEGFLRTFYERVAQLGILTNEEIKEIWDTTTEKIIYYSDMK